MVIICGHRKRVGKDTFCQMLQEILPNKNIVRVAFADALKEEIYQMVLQPFGLPKSILDNEETKAVMRPLAQWWGTEFRRNPNPPFNGDPDIWVKKLHEEIENLLKENPDCIPVICDGRFPNEYTQTKEKFATISIRVDRNLPSADLHVSETIMDSHSELYDYVIDNNGTLEEYKAKIADFVSDVLSLKI